MMRQVKIIISALFLALFINVQAGAQDSRYFLHTVTKGQGLYSISRMYGVSEDDIIKLNPGSEKVIKAGQELRIPQKQGNNSNRFHTIKQGETLYRLSVEYRVSVKEICDANPGLSAQNFKVGQVITIPAVSDEDPLASTLEAAGETLQETTVQALETLASPDTARFKSTHVVAKRETIYKISRLYGISQAEFLDANPEFRYTKLRQGAVVNIPFTAEELAAREQKRQDAVTHIETLPDSMLFEMNDIQEPEIKSTITAALLLPFSLDDTVTTDRIKMVEFYRGFLMAVEKLKNENISIDLKVVDCKDENESIQPILDSEMMKDVDIVFGPKSTSQIREAAVWSTLNKKRVVLPFNSNDENVFDNPNIFQLNTPESYFHQEIYDHFLNQFPDPNVIILDAQEFSKNTFIDGLKQTFSDHGIPYTTVVVDTASQAVVECLDSLKQNIFIINSDNSAPLNTMLPVLQLIERSKAPGIETHLFGYPRYQSFVSDHLEEMFEVDTYFYSWFYTNNLLPEAINFGNTFRRTFSRQMMVTYPSYAPYGYDTGYYFLKGLATYGSDFENHLNELETNPVQMGFKFERVNNWGGFINRKVFFVHFSRNYKVEKIDFDK